MRIFFVISLFLVNGCSLKQDIFSSMFSFALSKAIGIKVTFQEIDVNFSKVILKKVKLYDDKAMLCSASNVEVGIDLNKNKKISYIHVDNAEIVVDIDYINENTINWKRAFQDNDEFEEKPYIVPSFLGDISIRNSKCIFIDRSYSKKLVREFNNCQGEIVFDSENNSINIVCEGSQKDEIYSVNTKIFDESYILNLKAKNILLDRDSGYYTRAENILSIKEGRVDIDIEVIDKDFRGKIEMRDVVTSTEIFHNDFYIQTGNCYIDYGEITGSLVSYFNNEEFSLEGKIDLNREILNMNTDLENISLEYLTSNFKPFDKYYLETSGNVALNVEGEIDFKRSNANFKIALDPKDAEIFDENIKSAYFDVNLDITKKSNDENKANIEVKSNITSIDVNATFEKGYLIGKLIKNRGYQLSVRSLTNSKFLKAIDIELPIFRAENSIEVNFFNNFKEYQGKIDCRFIDMFLGEDVAEISFSKFRDNLNLDLKNNKFIFTLFKNRSDFSVLASFGSKSKMRYRDIECNLSGYYKIAGKYSDIWKLSYSNLNVNVNRLKYHDLVAEPFKLIGTSTNNNRMEIRSFDFNFNRKNLNVECKDINLNVSLLEKGKSLLIFNEIENIKLRSSGFIDDTFNDVSMQFTINNEEIMIKEISSNKFYLSGSVSRKEGVNINLELAVLSLNRHFRLENLYLSTEKNSINIQQGTLTIFEKKMSLVGYFKYVDNMFIIEQFNIGDNEIKGTFSKDLNLQANLYFDQLTKNSILEALDLSLSGEISIFGKIYDPLLLGNLTLNSNYLPKIYLSLGYGDFKFSFGNLYINQNNKEIRPNISGSWNMITNNLDVDIELIEEKLESSVFEGILTLYVSIKDDTYKILSNMTDFKYRGVNLEEIILDVNGNLDQIFLNKFLAKNIDDQINIEGSYKLSNDFYEVKVFSDKMYVRNILPYSDDFKNIEGYLNADLKIINNRADGFVSLKDIGIAVDISRYFEGIDSKLFFSNFNADFELHDEVIKMTSKGNLNYGSIDLEASYNLFDKKSEIKANIKEGIFTIPGHFTLNLDADIFIQDKDLICDLKILEGNIVDIYDLSKLRSGENRFFNIKEINISIQKSVDLYLKSFLNLEEVSTFLMGNLRMYKNKSTEKGLSFKGELFSEKGSIKFSNNVFNISNFNLSFNESSLYPKMYLEAFTDIVNQNITFVLEGSLDSKEVKVTDHFRYVDEERKDIFYATLFSSGNLELNDILYLLSYDGDSSFNTEEENNRDRLNFVGSQLSRSLIINPIFKKLKNFFGFYQFDIQSPFLHLDRLAEGDIFNFLENMVIDISTNVYKNFLFTGIRAGFDSFGENIDDLEISFFTLNRWSFFFSFERPFDNILFKGLGFSKKFIYNKNSFEIILKGGEGIISFSYDKFVESFFNNLFLYVDLSLRF